MLEKYPLVMQEYPYDCGAASLLMIIRYFKGDYSFEELRKITFTDKDGCNALNIKDAAFSLGIDAHVVKGEVKDLKSYHFPLIAHLKNKHFVVVYAVDLLKKRVILADPGVGRQVISLKEFEDLISKNYILFDKPLNLNLEFSSYMKNILYKFLVKEKAPLFFITLNSLIYTFGMIFLGLETKYLIDLVLVYQNNLNLKAFFIIFLSVLVIKNISDGFRKQCVLLINKKLDYLLTSDLFKHIISLPTLYYKNRTTGDILKRVDEINVLKGVFIQLIVSFTDILVFFISFLFLYQINSILAKLVFSMVVINTFINLVLSKVYSRNIRKLKTFGSKLNTKLNEDISNILAIKGYQLEDKKAFLFDEMYGNYLLENELLERIKLKEDTLKIIIGDILRIIILFIGGKLVVLEKLAVGDLLAFFSIFLIFKESFFSLDGIYFNLIEFNEIIRRLDEMYAVKKEDLGVKKLTKRSFVGEIKFQNFSYSYKKEILKDISLKIAPNSRVLLMGKSGSGKSTLLKALVRYVEVSLGDILIDDKSINDYSLVDLRRNILYVSMDEKIYSDSLYNNIVLGRKVDYDEFLKVAKISKIEELVKDNPFKYESVVWEDGVNFSTGEKARIILGRALLSNAKIIMLDEIFMHIEKEKEALILKDMFESFPYKTFIIISHRKTNTKLYTHKYKIEEGKLYEL